MSFIELTKERYSCRSLSSRPVEKEKIDAIIAAGMNAPTACNYQPARIWVVESEDGLRKVRSACRQPFVQNTPVIFIIGANEEEAWVREYDKKNFADVDASIIATQMMLETADLGLGTTWVGHFDVNEIVRLFPEMEGYSLIALFAVGYPEDGAGPSPSHFKSKTEEEMVSRL